MALRKKALFETPNRKLRKRRRMVRRTIILLLLLSIFAAGIVYFFRIPAFQISHISVNGAVKVDAEAIHSRADEYAKGYLAYFIPRTFFLAYPHEQLESALRSEYAQILSVSSEMKGFRELVVEVSERSPSALYCAGAECFIMDEDGLVYESASSTGRYMIFRDLRPSALAVSPLGSHPIETETFKSIKDFAAKLPNVKLTLEEIMIEENGDVSVVAEEGIVIISIQEPLDPQYEFLKIALSQDKFRYPDGAIRTFGYIDLRFGKKIFYKMQGGISPSASSASSSLDI